MLKICLAIPAYAAPEAVDKTLSCITTAQQFHPDIEVIRYDANDPSGALENALLAHEENDVFLEKDTTISFELIKAANGDLYYPVFTHGEELKKCSKEQDQHTMKVTFEDLANMILNQGKVVKGFVINPMGENICFTADMIEGMIHSMREEDAAKGGN